MKFKFLFILTLLPFLLVAQQPQDGPIKERVEFYKYVANEIYQVKLFGAAQRSARALPVLSDQLKEGAVADLDLDIVTELMAKPVSYLELEIPSPDGRQNMVLELITAEVFTANAKILTSDKQKAPLAHPRGLHLRGVVKGVPGSLAAISIFEDQVMGLVSTETGNLVIGKMDGREKKHIIYYDHDFSLPYEFECGTESDGIAYRPEELEANNSRAAGDCVKIYVEVDDDIVTHFGSSFAATNYITGLFNQSFTLYANESITMGISEMFLWTTTSPHTGGGSSGMLASFQSNTGAFNGDLGHLVSLKGGGGLAAGFSGICNSNTDQSLCYSGIATTYSNVPTYSWSVMVITHEMGHLLGSRHTHACVWNGNSTAIDGCSTFTEGTCALPGVPSGGGTIMSYCHINAVGINFSLGFGTQPGNVIRNTIINATCLCSTCSNKDLWIADSSLDIGDEPNNNGSIWQGDIWNCQNSATCMSNEKPEFKFFGNNYMRVRVQNRGCETSPPAVLHMYWTRGRSGEIWDGHWLDPVHRPSNVINGCPGGGEITVFPGAGAVSNPLTIPTLAPGASVILTKSWKPQNPTCYPSGTPGSFNGLGEPMVCFLGRIVSAADPMFDEQYGPIAHNVKFNNNIATRNSFLVDMNPNNLVGYGGHVLFNFEEFVPDRFGIYFNPLTESQYPFDEFGRIRLRLSTDLWEDWVAGGMEGEGIEVVNEQEVLVTGTDGVTLNNVHYLPERNYVIEPVFEANEGLSFPEEPINFTYQISHFSDQEPQGNSAGVFEVRISSDCRVDLQNQYLVAEPGQCATIGAPIACPDCEFSWEPADGLSDPNAAITEACVDQTTNYTFTMRNPETNCEIREEVVVYVGLDGRERNELANNIGRQNSVSIEPNPFRQATMISFELPESAATSINIYNVNGKLVAQPITNQVRTAGIHQLSFDASTLPNGIYFCEVKMGNTVETLKMIVQ